MSLKWYSHVMCIKDALEKSKSEDTNRKTRLRLNNISKIMEKYKKGKNVKSKMTEDFFVNVM